MDYIQAGISFYFNNDFSLKKLCYNIFIFNVSESGGKK